MTRIEITKEWNYAEFPTYSGLGGNSGKVVLGVLSVNTPAATGTLQIRDRATQEVLATIDATVANQYAFNAWLDGIECTFTSITGDPDIGFTYRGALTQWE